MDRQKKKASVRMKMVVFEDKTALELKSKS